MATLSIWRVFGKPVLELATSSRKLNTVLEGLISPPSQLRLLNKVRKISSKFSPPPPPSALFNAGEKVAESETAANLFASHFANVSRKDPGAPGARYRQNLEDLGVDFTSPWW